MRKLFKFAAIALAAGVVLFGVLAALAVALFDPNDYKQWLIDRVQQQWQRTLAIPGQVSLTIFPRLGVELGAVSLSEHGGSAEFASVRSARVSLALLPLFRRQLVADRIAIDGLHAQVVRFADGSTSIDDLLGKGTPAAPASAASSPAAAPLAIELAGVSIGDASIAFDDRAAKRRIELSKLSLETGRLAPGARSDVTLAAHVVVNEPAVAVDLKLATGLTLAPAFDGISLDKLSAEVNGRAATLADLALSLRGNARIATAPLAVDLDALELKAKARQDKATLQATLAAPQLSLGDKPKAAQKLRLDLTRSEGGSQLTATLTTLLATDLKAGTAQLTQLSAEAKLPRAGGTLAVQASGSVQFEGPHVQAALAGKIDDSAFKARLGVKGPSSYTADLEIDRLDLDRFSSASTSAPTTSSTPAPIDLSPLRGLTASGSLRVGALRAAGLNAEQLSLGFAAAGGKLNLAPITAKLYQGSLTGSMSATATQSPRFTVQNTLADIAVGPLLKDATAKPTLEGRGTVTLDVNTQGATVDALKRALAGSARIALQDGAIHGVNLAQAIRKARAALGGTASTGTAGESESTDFSEFGASFAIAHGVAHNEDLSIKTPLLRIGGAGDVDLGAGRLDYTVRATVVATLQGQGGPELQALRGQTIPVKLTGPFDKISYKVDLGSMVKDAAKDAAQQWLEKQLGGGKKGAEGATSAASSASKSDKAKKSDKNSTEKKLGDALKGLLKK